MAMFAGACGARTSPDVAPPEDASAFTTDGAVCTGPGVILCMVPCVPTYETACFLGPTCPMINCVLTPPRVCATGTLACDEAGKQAYVVGADAGVCVCP